MKSGPLAAAVSAVLLLGACANINSISRTTELPGKDADSAGRAIHLDAKQRVVLAKGFGAVCAEPNPDALSAYASSIGAGLSIPSEGAASIASALQETAGSIGLRTQSITLMRDALYRICEAYYGRAIDGPQVMQLLRQTQDLTLAVLAIEQLTGAVAARQVVMGGAAGAAASSNLAFVQSLLDNARQNEQQKSDAVKAAEQERDKAKTLVAEKEQSLKKADADTSEAEKQRLQNEVTQARRDLDLAQQKVDQAQGIADEAKRSREVIEKNHNAALTTASATASGSGVFANAIQPVTLDQKSTEHIATAVKEIVQSAVEKSYVVDGCLAFITRNRPDKMDAQEATRYDASIEFCMKVITTFLDRPSTDRKNVPGAGVQSKRGPETNPR